MGDRLIVASGQHVHCLNWPKYDAENFTDDALFWRGGPVGDSVFGRGFLTADSAFVPARDRLFRYDMRNGKAVDTYPTYDRKWDEASEGPGNVIVTSDHVVIAGADRVDVYTDLAAAGCKLDREVAAAPTDPSPARATPR